MSEPAFLPLNIAPLNVEGGSNNYNVPPRQSSKREICLFTSLMMALIAIVFLSISLLHTEEYISEHNECNTADCVLLSASVMQAMDQTVDPCDDFYTYACGGWDSSHPIPDDKASYGTFSVLDEANKFFLRTALESTEPGDASFTDIIQQARTYYSTCMDTDAIDALGASPVLTLLSGLDFWQPSSSSASAEVWTENDWQGLSLALAWMFQHEIYPGFYAFVSADAKNSSRNVINIGQSGLGLPDRSYYLEPDADVVEGYKNILQGYLELIGVESDQAKTQAGEVFDFEAAMAEFSLDNVQKRDPEATYNLASLDDLQTTAPHLYWTELMTELYPHAVQAEDTLELGDVIVESLEYLSALDALLTDTPPHVVRSYLLTHVLLSTASHLSAEFRDLSFQFSQLVYGVEKETDRWSTCVARVDSGLGFILGKLFVDGRFAGDSRAIAADMIADIKTAFKENLPFLRWMDDETRAKAEEKAEAVVEKIGYPDFILDPVLLAAEYSAITISETYFDNVINIRHADVSQNAEQLGQPVDRARWEMTPQTVNAYYNPPNNEIVFPAGIMQSPFFDQSFLKAYNYGGLGVVMGHELTHGFDDQGSQYDKNGNLRDWWAPEVRTAFEEQTQCIADQYSEFEFFGDHVNGDLTLGENIADNGGLTQAFSAYSSWVEKNGKEANLPGLGLSSEQVLFLGFAQVWCGNIREETALQRLLTDPHSPGKFRVIGTLSNSKDFSEAYQCPAGSTMNPTHKCEVW